MKRQVLFFLLNFGLFLWAGSFSKTQWILFPLLLLSVVNGIHGYCDGVDRSKQKIQDMEDLMIIKEMLIKDYSSNKKDLDL